MPRSDIELATLDPNVRLQGAWEGMETAEPAYNGLIEGCIAGERRSQQRMYELFYGKMMAVCLRYTKNHDQAKDILQDGFIKVYRSLKEYTNTGSLEGWIRRIMVNTAIDHFRRARHSYLLLGEDRSMEEFGDLAEQDESAEDGEAAWGDLKPADVINAMQKLTPAYRTVFNLYVFEEMTHKEIAETLDISIGTSKSNLAKAKANLKRLLAKEGQPTI
ncbi:MAG: RNA polymerase sigma factor [Flavobacteriales bacterium]|jgi:RNA polymerase sigma factor, sigma-70 family|nr:RNA polymerase sigma factor [Flavobacteriales bacterium]